jgi:hypothetical protein
MNVYLYIGQKKAQSFCILLLYSHLELDHVTSCFFKAIFVVIEIHRPKALVNNYDN